MKTKLFEISASDCAKSIRRGKFSCLELIESLISRIDKYDRVINAWEYFDRELAISAAKQIDKKMAKKEKTGNLAGVPIGIKDIFNTEDMPTGMGSPIWKGFTPGNDARVVARLRLHDMIVMGKTVTAEFAVHTPNGTKNPHNVEYSPGTSSSGSAAAVAAGMVSLALGTQTAGSIIRPASYCGIFGFKPSFGLIPRTGMLKTTDSLDTVGVLSRGVEDLKAFLDEAIVTGPNWPISFETISRPSAHEKGERPWKVAFVKTHMWKFVKDYVAEAFDKLIYRLSSDENFDIRNLELPEDFEASHQVHSTIYDKTLAYYFADEFKRKRLISPKMYEIIERGKNISLEEYRNALRKQNFLRRHLEKLFDEEKLDAILTVSTSSEAPKWKGDDIPDSCLMWTLTSSPVIGAPAFASPNPDKMPFGLQIVGRRYHDYLLLNLASDLVAKGYISEPAPCQLVM